jgi:hypothetical protein
LIRKSLAKDLALDPSSVEYKKLLDLEIVPRPANHSVSVSHCSKLGGYILARSPVGVGFDLEELNRINLKAIARVSTPEETSLVEGSQLLWPVKEALYKSTPSEKQTVLSDLSPLTKWSSTDDGLIFFESLTAVGVAAANGGIAFAIALYIPK